MNLKRISSARRSCPHVFWLTALVILVAVVAHEVVIVHEHPEGLFGAGVAAMSHGEDRKWWLALLTLAALALWGSVHSKCARILDASVHCTLREWRRPPEGPRTFLDPVLRALSQGILHPKRDN